MSEDLPPFSFKALALANFALTLSLLQAVRTKNLLSQEEAVHLVDQAQLQLEESGLAGSADGADVHAVFELVLRFLGPITP